MGNIDIYIFTPIVGVGCGRGRREGSGIGGSGVYLCKYGA